MSEALFAALSRRYQAPKTFNMQTTNYQLEQLEKHTPLLAADVLRYPAAASVLIELIQPPQPITTMLAVMHRWRNLYSPTRQTNHPLNLTLDAFNEKIPHAIGLTISCIEMRHAVIDLERLNLLLAFSNIYNNYPPDHPEKIKSRQLAQLVQITDLADLQQAVELIDQRTHNQTDMTKFEHAHYIARYLIDGLEGQPRYLHSAADNAVRWHQNIIATHAQRSNLHPNTATKRPHIALPSDEAIVFLDTAAAVIEEGQTMKHCLANYQKMAVEGECYLFRVNYQGSRATFQISARQKRIVQSAGFENSHDNDALHYAEPILAKWAEGL